MTYNVFSGTLNLTQSITHFQANCQPKTYSTVTVLTAALSTVKTDNKHSSLYTQQVQSNQYRAAFGLDAPSPPVSVVLRLAIMFWIFCHSRSSSFFSSLGPVLRVLRPSAIFTPYWNAALHHDNLRGSTNFTAKRQSSELQFTNKHSQQEIRLLIYYKVLYIEYIQEKRSCVRAGAERKLSVFHPASGAVLYIPHYELRTYCQRMFLYTWPSVWNLLPDHLRLR